MESEVHCVGGLPGSGRGGRIGRGHPEVGRRWGRAAGWEEARQEEKADLRVLSEEFSRE
jgi:hypothetical protein